MILLIVFAVTMVNYAAEAAPNNFISLVRSDTCERTHCILVKDLIPYDNSTQKISGKFVYHSKTGDYDRAPGLKNSHNYYNIISGKLFVFVEPDQTTLARSKIITIEKKLPEYITLQNQKKAEQDFNTDKRIIQFGMWFDAKCNSGIISANTGNITKAISYLAGGCQGDVGNTKEIITKKALRDYCGQECQHQKWLKAAKLKSKSNLLRP